MTTTTTKKTAAGKTSSAGAGTENFTDPARKGAEAFARTFNENFDQFQENVQTFHETVSSCSEKVRKRAQDIHDSLVEAVKDETADAVRYAGDLANVKNAGDMLELQRDYVTKRFRARMEKTRDFAGEAAALAGEFAAIPGAGFPDYFDADALWKAFPFSGRS